MSYGQPKGSWQALEQNVLICFTEEHALPNSHSVNGGLRLGWHFPRSIWNPFQRERERKWERKQKRLSYLHNMISLKYLQEKKKKKKSRIMLEFIQLQKLSSFHKSIETSICSSTSVCIESPLAVNCSGNLHIQLYLYLYLYQDYMFMCI